MSIHQSYWDRIGKPKPPFWGQQDNLSMARSLRLAVIQGQYDQGNLTKEQALKLLAGPLTPGDLSTAYDDSEYFRNFPLDKDEKKAYNGSDAE